MAIVVFRMRALPELTEDSPFDDIQLPEDEKQLYKDLGIKTVGDFLKVNLLEGVDDWIEGEFVIGTIQSLYMFEAIINGEAPIYF